MYVSIDIETTGLDPKTCQILEFAAVIDDWKSPIEKLPVFHQIIKHEVVSGSPYAMWLNSNLLKCINDTYTNKHCCDQRDLGAIFRRWLLYNSVDPRHVQAAGKNFAGFDAQFLKELPNFDIHFKHRVLDPGMLYWRPKNDGFTPPDTKTCRNVQVYLGK